MTKTLFVSIASFCDPHLQFTLAGLFDKAADPSRLRVAVIDQSTDLNRSWIASRPWAGQVRYIQFHPVDSRGCSWARSVAFSLYREEDFFLQIDSHTHFDEGWDEVLIDQLNFTQTLNPKAILSCYPPPFDFDEAGNPFQSQPSSPSVYWLRPMPELELSETDLTLRYRTEYVDDADFVVGHHIGGGFLFTSGHFIHDVPYDPYMYFHGDEQNITLRAFTRGWTIFHPRNDRIPLYHYYRGEDIGRPTAHWKPDFEKHRAVSFSEMEAAARRRLIELVTGARGDQPFGLGTAATLADFAEQSGIDYLARKVSDVLPHVVKRPESAEPPPITQAFCAEILPHLEQWFDGRVEAGATDTQLTNQLTRAGYPPTEIPHFLADQHHRRAHANPAATPQFSGEPDTPPAQARAQARAHIAS